MVDNGFENSSFLRICWGEMFTRLNLFGLETFDEVDYVREYGLDFSSKGSDLSSGANHLLEILSKADLNYTLDFSSKGYDLSSGATHLLEAKQI